MATISPSLWISTNVTFGKNFFLFLFLWRCGPTRAVASSFFRFLFHTQRRSTVGRTALDEWSARRRDLYLTTHNIHNKHACPTRIRTHNLSRRTAADLRLRPRIHWDRLIIILIIIIYQQIKEKYQSTWIPEEGNGPFTSKFWLILLHKVWQKINLI